MQKERMVISGIVEAVFCQTKEGSISRPSITLNLSGGVEGSRHSGVLSASPREKRWEKHGLGQGNLIANYRGVSMVSKEELQEIGRALGLSREIPMGVLGENIVISDIPEFSNIPPGSLLFFEKPPERYSTAALMVSASATPCIEAGKALRKALSESPKIEKLFPKAALGRRGLYAYVFAAGDIRPGAIVTVEIPAQTIYDPRKSQGKS